MGDQAQRRADVTASHTSRVWYQPYVGRQDFWMYEERTTFGSYHQMFKVTVATIESLPLQQPERVKAAVFGRLDVAQQSRMFTNTEEAKAWAMTMVRMA